MKAYESHIADIHVHYKEFTENSKIDLIESQRKWFSMTQEIVFIAKDLLKKLD